MVVFLEKLSKSGRPIAPRSKQDFDLLATACSCTCMTTTELCRLRGQEDDYIDRLLRSESGRAYYNWFRSQGWEFSYQFRPEEDREMELLGHARMLAKDGDPAAIQLVALHNAKEEAE